MSRAARKSTARSGSDPLILVCGPGRSGTSLAMSCLVDLGVKNPGEMIPSNSANEAGFWEDRGAVDINKKLLATWGLEGIGGFSVPMPKDWLESKEAKEAESILVEYLTRQRPSRGPWGFKDPRISVLLPLWLSAAATIGTTVRIVAVIRNPAATALSINKATGAPIALGEMVWLNRLAHLIRDAGESISVVHFEDLISDPKRSLTQIAKQLKLPSAKVAGADRLRPDLVHHNGTAGPKTRLARELYEVLRPLSGTVPLDDGLRGFAEKYFAQDQRHLAWQASVRFLQDRLNRSKAGS